MELSSRIKEYRGFLDWTQDDLAKNSGISISTIKKYEAGYVENFTYENLKKIASAFGISPAEFLDEFLSVNMSVNKDKNVRQSVDQSRNLSVNLSPSPTNLKKSHENQILSRYLILNMYIWALAVSFCL